MKRLLAVFTICFFSTNSYASDKLKLDNINIQQYNGRLGKWILLNNKTDLIKFSKRYSVSIKEIYELNKIEVGQIKRAYYFIPYSKGYLEKLKKRSIEREAIACLKDEFIWPVKEFNRITSVLGYRNGKFHPGIDIPALNKIPVIASMDGYVIYSAFAGGYGRTVVILHEKNFITRYSHNAINFVKLGDSVKKGQIIGLVGSTGNSTGNHLHFEIRCRNIPLDPLDFLPQKNDLHIVHTLKNWK